MHNTIQAFCDWCKKYGKSPFLITSLDEYNSFRGWQSKYIGRRVQVNADNTTSII